MGGTCRTVEGNPDMAKDWLSQVEVTLEPGELIYIPSDVPHKVSCLNETEGEAPAAACLSISMNFIDQTNARAAAVRLRETAALAFGGLQAEHALRLSRALTQQHSLALPQSVRTRPTSLLHWV